MAVPGNISSPFSLGTNKLIADGAGIVTVPEDILRAAGIEPALCEEDVKEMGEDERRLYELIMKRGELTADEICQALQTDAFTVNGLISVMEMKGIVSYHLGKIFIAKF